MSEASSSNFIRFLNTSFPTLDPQASESNLLDVSHIIYPQISYTANEKIEITQWLTTASHLADPEEDMAKYLERLGSLNVHLSSRTTLLGTKPSVADLAIYHRLAPIVQKWSLEERTGEKGYHHIVRFIDFVQNAPLLRLPHEDSKKVAIDPDIVLFTPKPPNMKAEKERKKKEKASAAANHGSSTAKDQDQPTSSLLERDAQRSNGPAPAEVNPNTARIPVRKKESKDKPAKQQKAPPVTAPLSPRLVDLRVGHILRAVQHPDADSLYVSTIACGDPSGIDNTSEYEGKTVRTVCSGLNGLIPLEEMQGRRVIVVCNLKPVTMRGIKSAAMVLAASPRLKEGEVDDHKGPVELVDPPHDAKAGERVCFEGWEGEPEGQLNPKKKIFETLQPGFTTTSDARIAFDAAEVIALNGESKPPGLLKTLNGGVCSVKSLTGALVR